MDENTENVSQQPAIQTSRHPETLPNSIGVLVMGIISIASCWMYGIPGLTLGIISLVLSKKSKKLYEANPGLYTESSYKNLKAGRTCAIVGVSLSAAYLLFIIFLIIYFVFLGLAIGDNIFNGPWDTYYY